MAGRERPGLAVPIALALAPTHRAAASHAGVASSATRRNTHTHTASDECWSACVVFPLSILLRCRVLWCAGFVVCFHSCSPNENRRRRGARGRGGSSTGHAIKRFNSFSRACDGLCLSVWSFSGRWVWFRPSKAATWAASVRGQGGSLCQGGRWMPCQCSTFTGMRDLRESNNLQKRINSGIYTISIPYK